VGKDGPIDWVGMDGSPNSVAEDGVTPKNVEGGLYVWGRETDRMLKMGCGK
jgi:hypothetical protein